MSQKKVGLAWGPVFANSTSSANFFPVTMWMGASDVKNVRGAFETILAESDVSVALAFQTANVENAVSDTPVEIGSYGTGIGVHYPSSWQDISTYTQNKQMIRFGWLAINTASATKLNCRVGGFVQISDS